MFDPQSGSKYSKDDDHIAQIIELIGEFPRSLALSGKYSGEFFNRKGVYSFVIRLSHVFGVSFLGVYYSLLLLLRRVFRRIFHRLFRFWNDDQFEFTSVAYLTSYTNPPYLSRHLGELRHIHKLRFWPIESVLHDKYLLTQRDADLIGSFLTPMLRLHPDKRAKASEMIHHAWLEGITVSGEMNVIRAAEEAERSSKGSGTASGSGAASSTAVASSSTSKKTASVSQESGFGGSGGGANAGANNKRTMEDHEDTKQHAAKRASFGGIIPTAADEADALKPIYSSDALPAPSNSMHQHHVPHHQQQHSPPPPQTTLPVVVTTRERDSSKSQSPSAARARDSKVGAGPTRGKSKSSSSKSKSSRQQQQQSE